MIQKDTSSNLTFVRQIFNINLKNIMNESSVHQDENNSDLWESMKFFYREEEGGAKKPKQTTVNGNELASHKLTDGMIKKIESITNYPYGNNRYTRVSVKIVYTDNPSCLANEERIGIPFALLARRFTLPRRSLIPCNRIGPNKELWKII